MKPEGGCSIYYPCHEGAASTEYYPCLLKEPTTGSKVWSINCPLSLIWTGKTMQKISVCGILRVYGKYGIVGRVHEWAHEIPQICKVHMLLKGMP